MPILYASTVSPNRFVLFMRLGVTLTSRGKPSLRTVIPSDLPLLSLMISEISSHFFTAIPSMSMIVSPVFKPASMAAEPGCRPPISDVRTGSPIILTTVKIRRASRILKTGPAATMPIRLRTVCLRKDLFSSSADNSSSVDSPSSFTYPPRGIRERRYSVSPIFFPMIFGPKPSENFRTPTPARLAIRKWPSSWAKIRTPSNITTDTMLIPINFLFSQ